MNPQARKERKAEGRQIFANQLRGIAAMAVVTSHVLGVFWVMRDFVGLATVSPVQEGAAPEAVYALATLQWLNLGPFGVAVFFLISGLVIPISLEKHSRWSFAGARLLRIYPTYLAALLVEIAVLHVNAFWWRGTFPYSNWTVISNALLIYNSVGLPSIDLVNWTLCIELKFYLIMLLLAPQIRRGSVVAIFIVACAVWLGNFALAHGYLSGALTTFPETMRMLSTESVYIVYMLVGVLFSYVLRGLLGALPGAAAIVAMLGLFAFSWVESINAAQFPVVTANYLWGFGLFAGAFLLRRHFRPVPTLDFFASISFPLYLVHSLISFSLLKVFMLGLGLSYIASLALTLPMVVLLASALHFGVEVHAVALGQRLAPRRGRAQMVAAAE